jgi:hypothetical protein
VALAQQSVRAPAWAQALRQAAAESVVPVSRRVQAAVLVQPPAARGQGEELARQRVLAAEALV